MPPFSLLHECTLSGQPSYVGAHGYVSLGIHTRVCVSTHLCRQSGCRRLCLGEDLCVRGGCIVIECVTVQISEDVCMECSQRGGC